MKPNYLLLGVGTLTLLSSTVFAGNLNKKYVNVSKEGLTAQGSDIPAGYGNIETSMKNMIADAAGNSGTQGSISGDVKSVSGKMGKGISFAGSDGADIIINNMKIDTTPAARHTVEFWMNWDGVDYGMPFSWGNYYDVILFPGSNVIGVNTGCSDWIGVDYAPYVNKWTHIAVVFPRYDSVISQSNFDIYINGERKPFTSESQSHCYRGGVTPNAFLGTYYHNGGGYHLKTQLDEVRVWNVARTGQQIKENMEKSLPAFTPNLIGYWNFEK